MKLSYLDNIPTSQDMTEEFLGYENNTRISQGAWKNMKNLTTDHYPCAAIRDKRSVQEVFSVDPYYNLNVSQKRYFQSDVRSIAYTDEQLIVMCDVTKLVKGEFEYAGCWFMNNGRFIELKKVEIPIVPIPRGNFNYYLGYATIDISNISFNANVGDNLYFFFTNVNLYSPTGISARVTEKTENLLTVQSAEFQNLSLKPSSDISVKNYSLEYPYDYGDIVESFKNGGHTLVRMGSRIFSFPDGVCYETADDSNYPVKTVAKKETYVADNNNHIQFSIYVADDITENGYHKIYHNYADENWTERHLMTKFETAVAEYKKTGQNNSEYGQASIEAASRGSRGYTNDCYRIVDGKLQQYVEESALWVNVMGYTLIEYVGTVSDGIDALDPFAKFEVGDAVNIKNTSTDPNGGMFYDDDYYTHVKLKGLMEYNSSTSGYNEINVTVIEKYKNNGRTGLVVEGLIYGYDTTDGELYSLVCDTTGTIEIQRKLPDLMPFGCCVNNRLWGCSKDGHEIYASALGTPYSWYKFAGITTDSVGFNVGTDGKFTGCCNFNGQPLFFKESSLHYISGSYASNLGMKDGGSFDITEFTEFNGVERGSDKSLVVINNILYYKSKIGIVAYDGANTTLVSSALGKERFVNAVAGRYGNKYYVSMQSLDDGKYYLLVYDTALGTWCKEDEVRVKQFLNVGGELVFLTDEGIWSVSDGNIFNNQDYQTEGDIEWMAETDDFGFSLPNHKYISRFSVRMELAFGAKASMYIQYNSDGNWHKVADMNGQGINSFTVPVVPMRCDHFRIKLKGMGNMKIISISKVMEQGGYY